MGEQGDCKASYACIQMLIIYQSLLPLLVVLFSSNDLLPKLAALPIHDTHDDAAKEPYTAADPQSLVGSRRILAAVTISSSAVLAVYSVPTTSALGASSAVFAAIGLVFFERAVRGMEDEEMNGTHGSIPATAVQTGRSADSGPPQEQQLAAFRDVATVLVTICGLTSILMEPSITSAISRGPATKKYDHGWTKAYDLVIMHRIFWMLPVNILTNALMYIVVSVLSLFLHHFGRQTLIFGSFLSTELYISPF
jgi:hypothetical protein